MLPISHIIKLHPWDIDPATGALTAGQSTPAELGAVTDVSSVHSWHYDEIVFNDPTEAFYNIAIANPPTPLPKAPRTAHHQPLAAISTHNGGVYGEFCAEVEEKEGQKIDAARNAVLAELETYRAQLAAYEAEVKQLKADIDGA